MSSIHFEHALTPSGWQRDVRVTIRDGRVAALDAGTPAVPGDELHGIGLPGIPNLHSHAFQRGMAGLAETRGPGNDSFWSWREVMYRFALRMTPDDLEAVAAQAYVEMLESGFTRVGEFHYLHHDQDGAAFADPAEMSARIAAAAAVTGIGLTLLPVFYAHGGFGGSAPGSAQRRFLHDLDGYARLLAAAEQMLAPLQGARLGVAPHSLRAVTPDELCAVAKLLPGRPIHIHIAEQRREVEECIAWSGAWPVAWLLAVPCAFAAAVLAPAGPAHSWALAALGLAAASRLTVAATWSRAVRGPGPAVLAWVLSPVRDLLAAAGLVVAALGRHVTKNGARFRVRGGGTLAPATQPHGAGL